MSLLRKLITNSGLSWISSVFTMEIRRVLSYRVDFWIHFLGNIITQIGLAYFLWRAVFLARGVDHMGGYSFPSLMLYYLMVPLVDRMVRGPDLSQIAQEIYDGGLNRYLIYPVSFFLYKYVSQGALSFLFAIQFIMVLAVFSFFWGIPADVEIQGKGILAGFVSLFMAMTLYFFLGSLLELVAFWADHVWSLMVMLRFVIFFSGGGMIPLSFFPGKIVNIMHFLPFPYLASFPIACFFGRVTFPEFLQAFSIQIVWILFFAGMALLLWRRGLRHYSGVGI